ncbi:MgtC/SapB family protein [Alloiococcus sp. CFN-8]|uniref:MgtC/SapB family protein n=1 Tax=Alloiococcus sp. CFN-8 TaxID=3416081 RepID=UPI003CEEAFDE
MGLAVLIGGAIGYERESKNRPAGFRTHILVCIGAAIISLISVKMSEDSIRQILANPDLAEVIKVDIGRLGAQVISGIGFLGAGTILHNKGSIKGLTTAASLWVVGCLGLAVGYGYYYISILGAVVCIIVLVNLKKIQSRLFLDSNDKKFEISYIDRKKTIEALDELFIRKNIQVVNIEFPMEQEGTFNDMPIRKSVYTIITPKTISTGDILSMFAKLETIVNAQQVNE